MNEELHKDPIEDFFKRSFEGFKVEPPEEMWPQIEAKIPPKPKAIWWALLRKTFIPMVILLGMGAIFIVIWQHQNTKKLMLDLQIQNKKIQALEAQIEAIQGQEGNLKTIGNTKTIEESKLTAKAEEQDKDRTGGGVEHPQTPPIQLITKTLNPKTRLPNNGKDSEKDKQPTWAESRAQIPSVHLSTILKAGPMSALPGKRPAFLLSEGHSEQIPSLLKQEQKTEPAFYYGLFTEALFSNQNLGYRPQFALMPIKTGQVNWGMGLTAGLQISSRFGLQSGLGFRWYNFHIQDVASLNYTFENTTINSEGQIIGNYQIPELGGISLTSQVKNNAQNDGADIQEGVSFNLVYDLGYQLQYYSIPVQLTYTIGNKRLKTQLTGGLIFHTTFGDKLQHRFINLSFNRLSPSNLELEVLALKNNFLEIGVGLGLQYEWTSHIQFGVGTTFYNAITPMTDKSHQSFGLNLNLNYRFTSN